MLLFLIWELFYIFVWLFWLLEVNVKIKYFINIIFFKKLLTFDFDFYYNERVWGRRNMANEENIEVVVTGTMSSGKSTLLNSLIGYDLLPYENMACTAKIIKIIDDDKQKHFSYLDGRKINYGIIKEMNKNPDIKEITIRGNIKGINNYKKKICFIDTPGTNNSLDVNHELITKEILKNYKEIVMFIINACNIGTEDEKKLLTYIAENKMNNRKFIFILNRADAINRKKESIKNIVDNVKSYVESFGILNPIIIPISADAAKLFKMVFNNHKLSEDQEIDFSHYYKYFKNDEYNLEKFSICNKNYFYTNSVKKGKSFFEKLQFIMKMNKKIIIEGNKYVIKDIYKRLQNTGIFLIEDIFDKLVQEAI